MKPTSRYLAIAAAMAIAAPCGADEIGDILAAIAANNSAIAATSASALADSLSLRAVTRLDDPELDFEYNFGETTGDKWSVGVAQSFLWPSIYSARGQAVDAAAKAQRLEAQATGVDILLQAKLLCINIIGLNKLAARQREVVANLDELAQKYSLALDQGEATAIDINKIKISRAEAKRALAETDAARASAIEALAGLNGGQPIAGVDAAALASYPIEPLEPLESYLSAALGHDPTALKLDAAETAKKHESAEAGMSWIPKISAGVKFTRELGDNFYGVTAGATLPFFSGRGKKAQAKARLLAAQSEKDCYQAAAEAQIKALYSRAESLRALLDEYAYDGTDSMALLRMALDGGQITLLSYLTETNYILEACCSRIKVERDYFAALAELNKLELLPLTAAF